MPAGNLDAPARIRRELAETDFEMDKLRRDLEMLMTDARGEEYLPSAPLDYFSFIDNNQIGEYANETRFKRQDDFDGKTVRPKRKRKESKKTINKLVAAKRDILRFYVVHKNFENLLQSKYLGPLYEYTNEMMKITTEYNGKVIGIDDFCDRGTEKTCTNTLNSWIKHADVLFRDGTVKANPNLQLSYPVLYLFNRPKDIGNVIYGVDVEGEKNEIKGARVLTLHWFVNYPATPENNAAYLAYRERLNDFWQEIATKTELEFIPHNDKAMDDEMMKIIESTVPFAVPATIMLIIFVTISNFSFNKVKSKPVEMYLGVWCVIIALIMTFGIFFYCGASFNPVTSTMPFLVLAVGVDDDFLMVGAWRELDRRLPVHQRIALVMGDAGASITVTSVTNLFCFALGWLMCSTPAVADFCLITAFGVFLDYLTQITFFAAILTYSGRKEETGGLASCCYKKTDVGPAESSKNDANNTMNENKIDCQHHAKAANIPYMHKFFEHRIAPFILKKWIKVISWLLYAVYAVISLYGCCILKVDISPVKYIRDNSPIQTFVKLADKYIWADNVMPTFYVMKPPDLRDPTQRAQFNEMVFRLEHTNYSIGRISTNLWVWQYQEYMNDFPSVDLSVEFYNKKHLRDFFAQLDYSQYRDKVKIIDNATYNEPCVSAFSFQTSFYGLDSWDKRQAELFHWRAIINEYPQYDMFLAGIFSPFLIDQRRTIAPSSMQTIGSALLMMAVISIFFLPDVQSVFLMTFSLLSISMGVCGGLALLGSDLDSVSMGCIVMAIGLAVDYSVHICYRYHRSEKKTGPDKVQDALSSVGWPVTQAVGSTLCGLAVLPLVPAYLIRVFFQTVYLVNIIGLIHAVLWLPQLIAALDPCDRVPLRFQNSKIKLSIA
ncbi:hypothetical protein WR25_21132 isoform A [Diploscapter pachys]|uniref:SSD domain-containing protein n=2 Tax=Diploscapter pachys TaxID=2018661 RepID=A0A2A2KXI1_9BILA|nr:hypothetical protein WR25_21132 isoform A [Diploscapter pachys]